MAADPSHSSTHGDTTAKLFHAVDASLRHPSVAGMASGLALTIRLQVSGETGAVDIRIGDGAARAVDLDTACVPDIVISADAQVWNEALASVPRPLFQSFSAWQLRNAAFSVTGEPLAIAQARSFLECMVERWHVPGQAVGAEAPRLDVIRGSYHRITGPDGAIADVFVESAGEGPVLLCLHTAGADSRQYHGLMASPALTRNFRTIAFDMPAHGRTMPAEPWDGGIHVLDEAGYFAWCVAVIEQVIGEPVTVLGCSMGAAMALVLAARRPDLIQAVVALEAPVRPRGRRNPFLTHAQVHGGWHSSAYVRGLMSPSSPLDQRRRAAWIYAQGGPGVYDGDLMFYSDQFDGEPVAKAIDGEKTPVVLMTGNYDFSATIADAHALAGWIKGARVVDMQGLGHFPMTEHPQALLEYLLPELERLKLASSKLG